MNSLLTEKYIAVEGKDNALKIAAALIDQDYQVFIQLEDCNVYIVAYTDNNTSHGGSEFALLDDDEQEYIEIQRNELAEKFNCVPSQINYVISTRFKPSQGYYVESRRGGGGNIKIRKINITKSNYFMHIINSIEDCLTNQEVDIFISNFLSYQMITETEAKLLKVATSDNVLKLPQPTRDEIRAKIFKNMLVNLIE